MGLEFLQLKLLNVQEVAESKYITKRLYCFLKFSMENIIQDQNI